MSISIATAPDPHMTPRILLVEDDPVSSAYLVAAIERLPARVDTAASVSAARTCIARNDYALWLVDANLPDGTGAALLAECRARGQLTPALAHTASHEHSALQSLLAAGFLRALVKPISAVDLHAVLREQLRASDPVLGGGDDARFAAMPVPSSIELVAEVSQSTDARAAPKVWDDDVALAALGGQRSHVAAMRALFIGELRASRDAVIAAAHRGDAELACATLHRLQASCGFVGACRLLAATRALNKSPASAAALDEFKTACSDALR